MNDRMIDLGDGLIVWPADIDHFLELDGKTAVYFKGEPNAGAYIKAEAWERIKPLLVMGTRLGTAQLPESLVLDISRLYRLLTAIDEGEVSIVTNPPVKDTLNAARKVCYGLIRHYGAISLKPEGGDNDAAGE